MSEQVILNGAPYVFTIDNLPCLIHYEKGMGGSHLSIVLFTQLFAQGYKLIFLCAYPQGEEKLIQLIGGYDKVSFVNAREDFPGADSKQVILLDSGNDSLLFDAANHMLPDFEQRIIFVKNIETFPKPMIRMLLDKHNVILSGDLDESSASDLLIKKPFTSLIAFNKPKLPLRLKIPKLEKWTAYLTSPTQNGIIQVQKML